MERGRRHRPLQLHGLAAAWLLVAGSGAMTEASPEVCSSVPVKTLSMSCGDRCEASQPCLAYSLAEIPPCDYEGASSRANCPGAQQQPSSNDSCGYECFSPYDSATVFKFYVAFNTTRSTKPPSSGSYATPAVDSAAEAIGDVPYENNAFVSRIVALELPSSVQEVVIAGGRTGGPSTRGTVVDVEIAADVFSRAPQVTAISLLNMDLGSRLPDIAAVVPLGTTQLDVSNTNLTQVPASLNRLAKLETLILTRNFITDLPSNLSLPTLTQLQLSENQLASFPTIDLPALASLDLSGNQLTRFPYEALTSLTKLHTLRVNDNPSLKNVIFTTDHFTKLKLLATFAIDSSALNTSSCRASQVQQLPQSPNQSICVVSVEEWNNTLQQRKQSELVVEPTSSSSLKTVIVGVLVGVVVLVGIVAFIIKQLSKRRSKPKAKPDLEHAETSEMTEKVADASGTTTIYENITQSPPSKGSNHRIYSLGKDAELKAKRIRLGDIQDVRVIGNGGFALVWLVEYCPQSRLLASKRLIRDQITRKKTMEFVAEIKLHMQLVHPSVVEFVGVAWTIESDLQALFEYMSSGDLRSHLEASPVAPWSKQKLKIALDIIEALVYVHSFSPPLVHRDLKSRNVLLIDNLKAKLSDFGVSRFESERGTMTYGVGTGRWLAPEVIAGSRSYDSSCDIYSFGVLLSEMDSHELPYEKLRGAQDNTLPDVTILQMVASGQLKPTMGETCPAAIKDLADQCLAFTPSDRPTAASVAASLYAIQRGCN